MPCDGVCGGWSAGGDCEAKRIQHDLRERERRAEGAACHPQKLSEWDMASAAHGEEVPYRVDGPEPRERTEDDDADDSDGDAGERRCEDDVCRRAHGEQDAQEARKRRFGRFAVSARLEPVVRTTKGTYLLAQCRYHLYAVAGISSRLMLRCATMEAQSCASVI